MAKGDQQRKLDLVAERLNEEIMRMIQTAELTPSERADLYALAQFMHLNEKSLSQNDFIYMYLQGDRDWRKDFRDVYGHDPGKSK